MLCIKGKQSWPAGHAGGSASAAAASTSGQSAAALAAETGAHVRMSGLQMARQIVRSEGVLGLYRGFGMSIATFVPTSGIWWGAYGAYQKLIWKQVCCLYLLLHVFPVNTSPQGQVSLKHVRP